MAANTMKDKTDLISTMTLNATTKGSVVLTSRQWDPQFHGSVHTATIAVCIVLVIFVVILGTFGNGLVLLSSLHCKMRSNFDILIYNLAVVDFIICAFLAPTFLYLLFSEPPSAKGFCAGYLFVCITCGLQSLLTLVAIAAHRQSQIRGFRGKLTCSKISLILVSIYAVSFACAAGATLQVTLDWSSASTNCQSVMNSVDILKNNIVLFFVSPIVVIGFLLITVSYLVIARAVKFQTALRARTVQPISKSSIYRPLQNGCNTTRDKLLSQNMHQIVPQDFFLPKSSRKDSPSRHCSCCSCAAALDKETKAVSMCYVVILIIALCWTPLIISHIVEIITGESIILYQVKLCGIALVFLNSALDPYMYAQNNTRVKQRYGQIFWDVLRCECSSRQRPRLRNSSPGFLLPRTKPNVVMCPEEGLFPCAQTKPIISPASLTPYHRVELPNTNLDHFNAKHQCNDNTLIINSKNANKCASRLIFSPNFQHPARCVKPHKLKKGNPQTSSVKTLVQKTCCNGNTPEDHSLMDSSYPRS